MLFRSLLASLAVAAAVSASSRLPPDFVYADGENFAVNGKKFYFFGSNAYWFSFLDVSSVFRHRLCLIPGRTSRM